MKHNQHPKQWYALWLERKAYSQHLHNLILIKEGSNYKAHRLIPQISSKKKQKNSQNISGNNSSLAKKRVYSELKLDQQNYVKKCDLPYNQNTVEYIYKDNKQQKLRESTIKDSFIQSDSLHRKNMKSLADYKEIKIAKQNNHILKRIIEAKSDLKVEKKQCKTGKLKKRNILNQIQDNKIRTENYKKFIKMNNENNILCKIIKIQIIEIYKSYMKDEYSQIYCELSEINKQNENKIDQKNKIKEQQNYQIKQLMKSDYCKLYKLQKHQFNFILKNEKCNKQLLLKIFYTRNLLLEEIGRYILKWPKQPIKLIQNQSGIFSSENHCNSSSIYSIKENLYYKSKIRIGVQFIMNKSKNHININYD